MENELKPINIVDILLDEDNEDPILLMGEDGKKILFDQVAVIPYPVKGETRLYAILKPIDEIEGVGDDEAIVFYVDVRDDDDSLIRIEEDESVARAVFEKYYELLADAN